MLPWAPGLFNTALDLADYNLFDVISALCLTCFLGILSACETVILYHWPVEHSTSEGLAKTPLGKQEYTLCGGLNVCTICQEARAL